MANSKSLRKQRQKLNASALHRKDDFQDYNVSVEPTSPNAPYIFGMARDCKDKGKEQLDSWRRGEETCPQLLADFWLHCVETGRDGTGFLMGTLSESDVAVVLLSAEEAFYIKKKRPVTFSLELLVARTFDILPPVHPRAKTQERAVKRYIPYKIIKIHQ